MSESKQPTKQEILDAVLGLVASNAPLARLPDWVCDYVERNTTLLKESTMKGMDVDQALIFFATAIFYAGVGAERNGWDIVMKEKWE